MFSDALNILEQCLSYFLYYQCYSYTGNFIDNNVERNIHKQLVMLGNILC